jgi:N-acetyltransferase
VTIFDDRPVLIGEDIRLEPLERRHVEGLVAAASTNPFLYRWSPVPRTPDETVRYVETALGWREAGTAVPFAILRESDGAVLGSTRFFKIERWTWPDGDVASPARALDVCEVGYTWLSAGAVRTAANTQAKSLMLSHAFEVWGALRVSFHTDVRNERSRAAIERIGGRFEGILRAHRIAADARPRDSARYSILAGEWPDVKERLSKLATRS